MESTSHVLAHGLDLYYTRITPAASYDRLAADFPFALLVCPWWLAEGCYC
jgi:ER membrane protein complex subunit 1, C-terminal